MLSLSSFVLLLAIVGVQSQYQPSWPSLDGRPLPAWYDQAKIGIFVHWGVYSVPGVATEWFWNRWKNGDQEATDYMNQNYKPGFSYQDFGPQFTAEFYNPNEWADLFVKSGAKYVVLTSKHHDGFTLWPSRLAYSWNAVDVGAHRDVLGELANAVRTNTSLRFGLYYSLYEWYHPLWMQDQNNGFTTDEFIRWKMLPELYDMVNTYEPDVVWSDGNWDAPDTYWQAKEFLAWLYNESPVRNSVVTNDRWGDDTICNHGGFMTCWDRFNPGVLQERKWENCFTIDKLSWGYRRNAVLDDYFTPEEIMTIIVESVSCNGNVLVNVGPTREGTIPLIQQERLLQMGEWLGINGEAIYSTIPFTSQNDTVTPGVWYTWSADKSKVYSFVTKWPDTGSVTLGAVNTTFTSVTMLGHTQPLTWNRVGSNVVVEFPNQESGLSKWVWTLVFG